MISRTAKILAFTAIVVGIGMICFEYVNWSPFGPTEPIELTRKSAKLNWQGGTGRMTSEPNDEERKAGMQALKNWKNLSKSNRALAATEIAIGKTLLGMDGPAIQNLLGEPSSFNTVKPSQLCFDCTSYDEDWRYLFVRLDKSGKVSDVFIMLNH